MTEIRPDRASHKRLSRGQRCRFVFALVLMFLASSYAAIALLTRVTPALFPGQSLPLAAALADLPGPVTFISYPSATSVFNRRINIVVMGMDTRPGDGPLDGRTDSLAVASIDPVSKSMSYLSIPRDLLVDIHPLQGPAYQDRINESFGVGTHEGGTVEAGAAQLRRDLKLDFGVDADYWVKLDIRGVERLVDALGGVDVTIPADLAVPELVLHR